MATTNSNTIGNRIGRAQSLVNYISGYEGFETSRPEDSPAEMQKLLDEIKNIGAGESAALTRYHEAIRSRSELFFGENGSVINMIQRIRRAVEGQYGKNTPEAESISMILRKISTYRPGKEPAVPVTTTSAEGTVPAEPAATRSRSTRSYNNLKRIYLDVVNTVQEFGDFNPRKSLLEIAELQKLADQANASGNTVDNTLQSLQMNRNQQRILLDDLVERCRRIKSCVEAQYGRKSEEYKRVSAIRI
jgi:hypothetical protein